MEECTQKINKKGLLVLNNNQLLELKKYKKNNINNIVTDQDKYIYQQVGDKNTNNNNNIQHMNKSQFLPTITQKKRKDSLQHHIGDVPFDNMDIPKSDPNFKQESYIDRASQSNKDTISSIKYSYENSSNGYSDGHTNKRQTPVLVPSKGNFFNKKSPIDSYGIIPFYYPQQENPLKREPQKYIDDKYMKNPLVLLQQRRDNYEYIDLIRSNWKSEEQFIKYFTAISIEERNRIRDYVYEELWDDLHIDKTSKLYKEGYIKCKKKFDSIKHLIPDILKNTSSTLECPPWAFPKGRKDGYDETEIECAIRETREETKIDVKHIKVYPKNEYYECYIGTNEKKYAATYYLAIIDEIKEIPRIHTPDCIRKDAISEETMDARWIPYEECLELLNERHRNILIKAYEDFVKIINNL